MANSSKRQSALATLSVPYPVTFEKNGTQQDPTSYTVDFAFMTTPTAQPATADWKAGTWETDTVTGPATPYVAVTPPIGPAGTITTLTATSAPYYVWIRITVSATAVEIEPVGTLTIF